MKKMPLVSSQEVVYEETPRYVVSDQVPERVHDSLPNSKDLKFVHIVCDPLARAFSDYSHILRRRELEEKENFDSFEVFVNKSVETLRRVEAQDGSGPYRVVLH